MSFFDDNVLLTKVREAEQEWIDTIVSLRDREDAARVRLAATDDLTLRLRRRVHMHRGSHTLCGLSRETNRSMHTLVSRPKASVACRNCMRVLAARRANGTIA